MASRRPALWLRFGFGRWLLPVVLLCRACSADGSSGAHASVTDSDAASITALDESGGEPPSADAASITALDESGGEPPSAQNHLRGGVSDGQAELTDKAADLDKSLPVHVKISGGPAPDITRVRVGPRVVDKVGPEPSSSIPKGFARIEAERAHRETAEPALHAQAGVDHELQSWLNAWKPTYRNLPPVPADGGPLAVGVRMQLVKFQDLDEVAGTINVVLDLMLCWSDDRLSFDSLGPFSRDKRSIKPKLVWTPDIVVLNQVADMEQMFDTEDTPVVIADDSFKKLTGVNVLWKRRLNVISRCGIDMSRFPFDSQRCSIIFGSWASSRRQLLLIPQDAHQHKEAIGTIHTSEFRVLNITVDKRDVYMRNAAERFEEIQYDLELERFPHFYIVNFMLPMVAVTMLTVATMWMSNAGTRMNSGTRLLLCVVQIMNITASWRPANDTDIWLDKFQSHCLALTMASVLQSLVMDYLLKTGLFEMQWSPKSHTVDTLLRTAICLTTMFVFVADLCDLMNRRDPRGLYGSFHAHSSKLLVGFVYTIFMMLGISSVFSTLWLILPAALFKRMCCKGCSTVASGGDDQSPPSSPNTRR